MRFLLSAFLAWMIWSNTGAKRLVTTAVQEVRAFPAFIEAH